MISEAQQTQLVQMTVGLFNAAPGVTYMNDFAKSLNAGSDVASLAKGLVNSPAFTALYPLFDTNTQFANKYMSNLLGNTVSVANKEWAANWMAGQLNAGVSRADAVLTTLVTLLGISSSDPNWGLAVQQFNNRVDVAKYYTLTKNGNATDLASLQGTISSVGSDAASVTQAKTQIDNSITPVVPRSYSLTAANAVLSHTGTSVNVSPAGNLSSNDDTITANNAIVLSGATLLDNSATDNDTLNITLSSAVSTAPTINRIENINIESYNSGEMSLANVVNSKTITIKGTSFIGTGASSGQSFTLSEINGAQKFDLATEAGAVDSLTFQLVATGNAASLDVGNGALENINLNVNSNSSLTLADGTNGGNAANVVISGVANLTLTNADSTANNVINGSSLMGVLNYTHASTAHSAVSVTGGSGNDSFAFATDKINATTTVNGGAGTDTLNLTGNTAQSGVSLAGLSNLETIAIANTTTDVSLSTTDNVVAAGAVLNVITAQSTGKLTFNGSLEIDGGRFSIIGGAGDDSLTGGNSLDTLNGAAGNDSLVGGTGADMLTGGEGSDTFVGGEGTDTLILSEIAAARDVVVLTHAGIDMVSGFAKGAGTTNDVIVLSLSALETAGALATGVTVNISSGNSTDLAANNTATILTVSGSTTLTDANVLYIAGNYATVDALVDSLGTGGSSNTNALTTSQAMSAGEAITIVWNDNSGAAHVGLLRFTANVATSTALVDGNVVVHDLVQLVGVSAAELAGGADGVTNIGWIS